MVGNKVAIVGEECRPQVVANKVAIVGEVIIRPQMGQKKVTMFGEK